MLAAQAGVLRLAVRSADEKRLARYWAGESYSSANLASTNRDLIQFSQLAMTPPPKPVVTHGGTAPRKPSVEVIRGIEITQQTP
jgi:pilus assembly protein CpaB